LFELEARQLDFVVGSLWDIQTNEFGESWVVMEYVPGPSLRDVVEANPQGMPVEEVKRWFVSTASGVAYLHEHGIVHRDLKPGNVFCDQDGVTIVRGRPKPSGRFTTWPQKSARESTAKRSISTR